MLGPPAEGIVQLRCLVLGWHGWLLELGLQQSAKGIGGYIWHWDRLSRLKSQIPMLSVWCRAERSMLLKYLRLYCAQTMDHSLTLTKWQISDIMAADSIQLNVSGSIYGNHN